jgi:hypothetical protein
MHNLPADLLVVCVLFAALSSSTPLLGNNDHFQIVRSEVPRLAFATATCCHRSTSRKHEYWTRAKNYFRDLCLAPARF